MTGGKTLSVDLAQCADEGVAVLVADFAVVVAVAIVETCLAHAALLVPRTTASSRRDQMAILRRNTSRLGLLNDLVTRWRASGAVQIPSSLLHWPAVVFRRIAGADIDFATARAEPMNSSANGLIVRRLTVTILTEARKPGTFIGSTFSPTRFALNCATELGRIPTNFPVATSVVVSCTDNVAMLEIGGFRPTAWKILVMSSPGALSGGGRTQDSSASSASSICRRRAHRLWIPATVTKGSSNNCSATRSSSINGCGIRPINNSTLRSRSWSNCISAVSA